MTWRTEAEGASQAPHNPQNPQDPLEQLISRGFRFVHPCDAKGEIVAVVGIRAHHGVIDVVELWAEDEVTARRIPGDEENVLRPRRELWSRSGPFSDVLDELLRLGDDQPGLPDASGGRQKGCWVPVRPGHAAWLGATA